jgi:hypothetical protein
VKRLTVELAALDAALRQQHRISLHEAVVPRHRTGQRALW